jgi:3-isopropylmalate/(R)-2-methylmalate dehydratase small subunit
MKPFVPIDAIAVPLRTADIDTDQIVPARFMHKERVDYGRYCFHDQRFDAVTNEQRESFVMNWPVYRGGRVIVAGRNFGCGSSREQAVHTLQDFGIDALIAPSFGDIFYTNCLKNGVLPIRLQEHDVVMMLDRLEAHPGTRIFVDLHRQETGLHDERPLNFEIDAFSKAALLGGVDEIDFTLNLSDAILNFESTYRL